MKQIILASASVQRKKLLKLLGLSFTVRPSRIQEIQKVTTTCSSLVKKNALLKARDGASKTKDGIVIGADTVVYIGRKRIIGKPKNYKDARRILKILFSRPQWIYTGVAVVDARTGRQLVDYEKTKVFMLHLTDEEIDQYHRRISPFDKAGGFDIEGWGSIFIHRIEGCYSNVIGLPMAKLAGMLKKFGISVLSFLIIAGLSGCATEYNLATQKQESLMYGTEREVKIGESAAQGIEQHYKILQDIDVNERVERILERIVEVCDRKDILYFIKVIDDGEIVNAVSLPGGYIYIFKGLIDEVTTDDQLAGVIAHEVAHITARHGVKRLQNAYAAMAVQVAAATQTDGQFTRGVNLAINSLFIEHSQQDEFESDKLAVKYTKKAGYDPQGMIEFLEILREKQAKDPPRRFSYWRTHPHLAERVGIIHKEITGALRFKDYMNLIDRDVR